MPRIFVTEKYVNLDNMPEQEDDFADDSDCEIISKPGSDETQHSSIEVASASALMPNLGAPYDLTVVAGDLHSNAIKLLFILISYKIVSNVSNATYKAFLMVYKKNVMDLTREDIDLFKEQLELLTFSSVADFISLGDLLSDRGNNDIWILLILQKLMQAKINIELLLSNHDFELIKSYEMKERFAPDEFMLGEFSRSLEQMQILIDRNLITREDVLQLVETVFKPILKIISYSLDATKTNITIYSHAPIDLQIIRHMSLLLGIPYKDHTAIALASTIDLIQKHFVLFVQQNKVHQLCYASNENPFYLIMQNRDFQKLTSLTVSNYFIGYIHGHAAKESLPSEQSNVMINLNSWLGMPGINQGILELVVEMKANQKKLAAEDFSPDTYLFIPTRSSVQDYLTATPKDLVKAYIAASAEDPVKAYLAASVKDPVKAYLATTLKDPVDTYLCHSSNPLRFFNDMADAAPRCKRGRFETPELAKEAYSYGYNY